MKRVRLASFPNVAIGRMVCELLRNNQIDAVVSGEHFAGVEPLLSAGGFSEAQLLVPEDQLELARELYDAYFAGETVH
jgi:hypothetical protein